MKFYWYNEDQICLEDDLYEEENRNFLCYYIPSSKMFVSYFNECDNLEELLREDKAEISSTFVKEVYEFIGYLHTHYTSRIEDEIEDKIEGIDKMQID